MLRFIHNNHIYDEDFKKPFEEGGMYGHVDLPRLKKGKNGGAFWSAFAPCPSNGSDFSDENYSVGKSLYTPLFICSQYPRGCPPSVPFYVPASCLRCILLGRIIYCHSLLHISVLKTKQSAPCTTTHLNSTANTQTAVDFTLTQIDLLTRLQAAYPNHFSTSPNGTTALEAFKAGLLISPIIIEGLHQIGNKVSNLRLYHSLGVRYATLTHNCHNKYADAAITTDTDGKAEKSKPHWGGVSPDGKELIAEMNRLGMIVDLSHVSVDTMRDVLGGSDGWSGSTAPIMFSHSSAYAVCPHPRNVPDDILQLVKKRNSVVMVNFAPDFVSCVANSDNKNGMPDFYPPNSTLSHVVKHIKHIGELVGYDYVGLGSDFDGIPTTPEGLDDVSKFPDLVKEMLKQGVSDEDAGKVVGGNILRVWRSVDEVALKMQAQGAKPLEDKLPSLKFEVFSSAMGERYPSQ